MAATRENEADRSLDGRTLYIVSDLHMGDGDRRDNFSKYRERFENFLTEVVETDPECCLILAGDVFEFWQCEHGRVVKEYLPLLERVLKADVIYIPGNHDIDVLGFVGLPIRSRLIRVLREDVGVTRGDRQIRICHGHEFDRYNNPQRWIFLGKIGAIIAGEAEARVPIQSLREKVEALLVRVLKWALVWCVRRYRAWVGRTAGERTEAEQSIDYIRRELDKHRAAFPKETVIAGHTHKAGWYGEWYVNCGAWQGKEAHYVKVTAGGEISLHEWPGQRKVGLQLWAE